MLVTLPISNDANGIQTFIIMKQMSGHVPMSPQPQNVPKNPKYIVILLCTHIHPSPAAAVEEPRHNSA